jgi:hypothetical protein
VVVSISSRAYSSFNDPKRKLKEATREMVYDDGEGGINLGYEIVSEW